MDISSDEEMLKKLIIIYIYIGKRNYYKINKIKIKIIKKTKAINNENKEYMFYNN